MEAAILSGISGVQTPLSGLLNTFTPTRGATTVVNQVVVAEKATDIGGEWTTLGQEIHGETTLIFYKRRDVVITANVFKSAGRTVVRVADQAKKGFFALATKFANKPSGSGYVNFEKAQRATEKHEELKEKLKEKRFKCRCLVPIDINYILQAYLGLPADVLREEKEEQEAYEKKKAEYDLRRDTPFEMDLPPRKPDVRPRWVIYLFKGARADLGSGLDNSLGETLTFSITLIPKWDNYGRRYLNIAWKANGGGMKFSRGFEHSGTAVAIIDKVTAISPYGEKYQKQGLVPAPQQDEPTKKHFLEGHYGTARQPGHGEEQDVDFGGAIAELRQDFGELPVGSDDVLYGQKEGSSRKPEKEKPETDDDSE